MEQLILNIPETAPAIPFFIGDTLQQAWLSWLRTCSFPRCFWFVDENVHRLFQPLLHQLQPEQMEHLTFPIPSGEEHKSRKQRDWIEDQLLAQNVHRQSLVVAVGGGMVGDLVGFVAATVHRGVPFVFFPTTLLAQVDSCLGGKVGINHPLGKNLLGTIYHPQAVFVDLQFLQTLEEHHILEGLAEVFKYALIFDLSLLKLLDRSSEKILQRVPAVLQHIVFRSLFWKKTVVEKDVRDRHFRTVLNFGHTTAHALERELQYRISHGFAVLWGLRLALQLSVQMLDYPEQKMFEFERLWRKYPYLPYLQQFLVDPDRLWEWMVKDKKNDQQVRFTLLDKNAQPALFVPVSREQFLRAWNAISDLSFVLGQE